MPSKKNDQDVVIPVDLIKEIVMPPYRFQELQFGFGCASYDDNQNQEPKKPSQKSETKHKRQTSE